MENRELQVRAMNGWGMVGTLFVTGVAIGYSIYYAASQQLIPWLVAACMVAALWGVACGGFFTLQPNQAEVLILFGKYKGSVKECGFCWANPLLTKKKISQRAHNLNGATIKVNDLRGNPIEIAAVIVWRIVDTARAVFDVEDYRDYVSVQSESALRHLASAYPYDTTADHELSLRGSMDEVSLALQKELEDRVARAGVHVEEARLSHLAYAPEIAGALLQRQQAAAIVAARTRIVAGA
ncbi:MAG: SPFH domain-containing protein, partial [Planctomycetota bacterium]